MRCKIIFEVQTFRVVPRHSFTQGTHTVALADTHTHAYQCGRVATTMLSKVR